MHKLLLFLIPLSLAAQCNVLSTGSCPTTGSPATWTGCANAYDACGTGPTYRSFVNGASTALPWAGNSVSILPQPRMSISAQLFPAGVSVMPTDPTSCGGTANTGPPTCYWNQIGYAPNAPSPYTGPAAGQLGYAYWMTLPVAQGGLGLNTVDVQLWLGPLFVSSQYLASGLNYCGTYGTCYGSGGYTTWYTNSLATYDALFAYLASLGVNVNVAPTMSADTKLVCGIPSYATPYTEAEIQACEAPLEAAAAKRWNISHFSVEHEPCGVQELIYGTGGHCYLSTTDEGTLIASLSTAVRATRKNSGMLVGAGAQYTDVGTLPYACPSSSNYWCYWITSLPSSLDYYSVHVYPVTQSNDYTSGPLSLYAYMCSVVPSGKICLADESSPLRYLPTGSTGEGSSIFGCGDLSYLNNGSYAWWAGYVVGEWGPASGFKSWSEFDSQRLIWLSSDPNNTHCNGSDNYPQNIMTALPTLTSVSPEGKYFASLAGPNTSMQGASVLSGPSHLANVNGISNVTVSGVTAQQATVSWTAASTPTCNVVVSTTQVGGVPQPPYIYDTDVNTFAGSTAATRPGSLVVGTSQTFVLGQRASQLATAGTYSGLRYFSRSLQAATPHYGLITCGGYSALFNLTTSNIPLGQTYGDPWPVDPANPGIEPWPASLGGTTPQPFVDHLEGALLEPVTLRGNQPTTWTFLPASAFNQGQTTPCDAAGPWSNPCGSGVVTGGSGTTSVGNSTAPLVLRMPMGNNYSPWTTNYNSGFSIDQFKLALTGSTTSVISAFQVLDGCLLANGGASCAGPVQKVTVPTSSGPIVFGQADTTQYGTIPWMFDTSPRLNGQEMTPHKGTGTVSFTGGNYYLANNTGSGDSFSLYWITGGAGTIRISTTSTADACISPPATPVTGAEYRIVGFTDPTGSGLNGNYIQVAGTPPTGSVYWCEGNFAVMVWRDVAPTDGSTITLTGASMTALGSYDAPIWDNGAGTSFFNTQVYGGYFGFFGGMSWLNPTTGASVYYGQPVGLGQTSGGVDIANPWRRVTAPMPESAQIDQSQSNLTWYMTATSDTSDRSPLVLRSVFTPTATPVQCPPQGGNQICNAPVTATDNYSVTWSTSTPSPWSMTWTNLTPQVTPTTCMGFSSSGCGIVQQMAVFDPTFIPSQFDQGGSSWTCSLTAATEGSIYFLTCLSYNGDSPGWIIAYSPGDGNPAHAGQAGGPQVIGAINTFNTPKGAIAAGQAAIVGHSLHTVVESGTGVGLSTGGWVDIVANEKPQITTSSTSIPSSGPAKCNTFDSSLSSTADCIAVQMNSYTHASVTGYEPYWLSSAIPINFTGAPGELRTTQIGDTACFSTSATSCSWASEANELMTLRIKNYTSPGVFTTPGNFVFQRGTYGGVEKAVTSPTLRWESYQSSSPVCGNCASQSVQAWWNPLTGCSGAPDPHGDCMKQDNNISVGHGEYRSGAESVTVNVPVWAIPSTVLGSPSQWPGDWQVTEGAVPSFFSLASANEVPPSFSPCPVWFVSGCTFTSSGYSSVTGVNFVNINPPFAGVFGTPLAGDAQTHPNPPGVNASSGELTQAFDNVSWNGLTAGPNFSLVSGQLYRHRPGTVTDPDDFYSGANAGTPASSSANGAAYINRKLMATGAKCGHSPLVDVSGPSSSIGTGGGSAYTYCISRAINECVSGSAAGDIYVNCPGVTVPGNNTGNVGVGCNAGSYHPGTPFGVGNDICVSNIAKVANTAVQYTIANTDYYGADSRSLASATSTVGMVTNLENNAMTPANEWLMFRAEFLNLQREDVWAALYPPYPAPDSYNRGAFIPVNVPITTPGSLGITAAIVEFGYQEYAQSGTYYCTTRADICQANATSIPSGFSPFKFTSESAAGLSCAVSCTIQVPAISQRVLYYRVRWLNGSTTVQVGAWNATVVP